MPRAMRQLSRRRYYAAFATLLPLGCLTPATILRLRQFIIATRYWLTLRCPFSFSRFFALLSFSSIIFQPPADCAEALFDSWLFRHYVFRHAGRQLFQLLRRRAAIIADISIYGHMFQPCHFDTMPDIFDVFSRFSLLSLAIAIFSYFRHCFRCHALSPVAAFDAPGCHAISPAALFSLIFALAFSFACFSERAATLAFRFRLRFASFSPPIRSTPC
jgi:hypothetical protein